MRYNTKVVAYAIVVLSVIVYGVVGTYFIGNNGGFNQNVATPLNALYFTVITLSTVGYGDFYPVSPIAKIFVITLIIVGLGTFISAITTFSGEFMNRRIERISGRISSFERRALNKHMVLIGDGPTNLYIANKLSETGERFIIIVKSPESLERLKKYGYMVFQADLSSDGDMREMNLDKAKAVVIDVADNSTSLYALVSVKELAGNAEIIVVAPNKDAEHHLKIVAGNRAVVVNPSTIAGNFINDRLFKG
jgi:voltage-gated potassium channel